MLLLYNLVVRDTPTHGVSVVRAPRVVLVTTPSQTTTVLDSDRVRNNLIHVLQSQDGTGRRWVVTIVDNPPSWCVIAHF